MCAPCNVSHRRLNSSIMCVRRANKLLFSLDFAFNRASRNDFSWANTNQFKQHNKQLIWNKRSNRMRFGCCCQPTVHIWRVYRVCVRVWARVCGFMYADRHLNTSMADTAYFMAGPERFICFLFSLVGLVYIDLTVVFNIFVSLSPSFWLAVGRHFLFFNSIFVEIPVWPSWCSII